jgi:hypothetical protein
LARAYHRILKLGRTMADLRKATQRRNVLRAPLSTHTNRGPAADIPQALYNNSWLRHSTAILVPACCGLIICHESSSERISGAALALEAA